MEKKKKKIKLKNYELSLENYKKNIIKSSRNILESYALNSNKNQNLETKDKLSEHSEEIKPKYDKLHSTNFILDLSDLSKIKKRNTVKNSLLFKSKEEFGKTPQIRPIKKSNYYSLFVKNLSKKYKNIKLLQNINKNNSNENEDNED